MLAFFDFIPVMSGWLKHVATYIAISDKYSVCVRIQRLSSLASIYLLHEIVCALV